MVDLGLSSCFDMHRENRISGTTAPWENQRLVIFFVEDKNHPPVCCRSHRPYHDYIIIYNELYQIDPNSDTLVIIIIICIIIIFFFFIMFFFDTHRSCRSITHRSCRSTPDFVGAAIFFEMITAAATVRCDWRCLAKQETKNNRFMEYINDIKIWLHIDMKYI